MTPVLTYVTVIVLLLLVVFLVLRKEGYTDVSDYRIDLQLREIENKQYDGTIEHFKSYDGLDKPQGITNTKVMRDFYKLKELSGEWDNFNITRPIYKSSPVPEYLPQDIVSTEVEYVHAYSMGSDGPSLGDESKRIKGSEMDSALNKYIL